jgi:transposase-like protein
MSLIRNAFKRLHYPVDIITQCVRGYLAYALSLRNPEEIMAERGIIVDHSTLHRWVIRLVPLPDKAFRRHKRSVGRRWRMDETCLKIKGQWKYRLCCINSVIHRHRFNFRSSRSSALVYVLHQAGSLHERHFSLPTSHMALTTNASDEFTQAMLKAINGMMLDMLAAIARKDYKDRRRRQEEGISKAKAAGKFRGRQADRELHERIIALRVRNGQSIRETARLCGVSERTVIRIVKNVKAETERNGNK